MNCFETIFLGIVQGLTEFLPISSSGHLVLFQNLLGFKEPELLLVSSLHLGTLMAVCLYFNSDIKGMVREIYWLAGHIGEIGNGEKVRHAALALWVTVGSIPSALIWLIFRKEIESLFASVPAVGLMLIMTGLILSVTVLIRKGKRDKTTVGVLTALAVGTTQGLALLPGISRSGITIVCCLLFGLDRDLAGRFSFLLSIPAIIGAVLLNIDITQLERVGIIPLFLGFLSSAIVGFFALKLLMGMVKRGRLYYFAPYCLGLGAVIIFLSW
jgi:undecaprenyl-diphosphatase